MFKIFSKILKVPAVQRTLPYLKNSYDLLIAGNAAAEVRESFMTASNSTLPIPKRAIDTTKGICCTGDLVTAYLAARVSNPGLAATFRVCYQAFTTAYMFTGGDLRNALSFIYNSTHPNKP